MNTAQGSLVIVGANTAAPQLFFSGLLMQGVTDITVAKNRVVVRSTCPLPELVAAGVIVKETRQ